MAAATIFLRRSANSVISAGHFLSAATKRSHLFVPTAISSVRQFSSSPAVHNIQNPSSDLKNGSDINQQAVDKDKLVRDMLSQLGAMKEEIEFLRKANESKEESPKEKEAVLVKEKHPLLREIEAAMSSTDDETSSRAEMLPDGFEVECDKPGVAKVTLKKAYKKESINIEVFTPTYDYDQCYNLKLIVKVSFSRLFSSTAAEFHCTAREDDGLIINKIKDPSDGTHCEGIIFNLLPESLQTKLYHYLEIRGIDDELDMLHMYMVDKMKRENMRGLGKFKKLVEGA